MPTRDEVESFLSQMRIKLDVFDIVFRPRGKNLQALLDLEITAVVRKGILKKLSAEHYASGPNQDTYDLSAPDYFEFGFTHNGIEVYIKLSLGRTNKQVDCMSFHPSEHPMTYPFK